MSVGHDIIVIGASAGGVQALKQVVGGLPIHLAASVLVVVHTSPNAGGTLDRILNRLNGQRARYAQDGMKIERNTIYIAPPDRHMLVDEGKIRISGGPRQNRNRPAIDALFRSAANAYGQRVIGVVLTGYLDDGSAGLARIKKAGGTTMVQDPEDATVSGMPEQALLRTYPDYCLPLDEIPRALEMLVREPMLGRGIMAGNGKPKSNRDSNRENPRQRRHSRLSKSEYKKEFTGLTCPDCNGAMWEVREGNFIHFKCRMGHSYSPESMIEAHGDSLERALWAALRSLEENIALTKRLVEYSRTRHRDKAAEVYVRQIREKEKHATILHALLDGNSNEMLKALNPQKCAAAARKANEEESAA